MVTRWYCKYENFVKNSSENAGEVESALKWLSYIISGRSKASSSIFAEFLYSTSNVLSLVNDTILRGSIPQNETDSKLVRNLFWLKTNLTVLEYVEVLLELASSRMCGNYGKWLIITLVQLLRAALRTYLLFAHGCTLLRTPPIPPMSNSQRKKLANEFRIKSHSADDVPPNSNLKPISNGSVNITFTLKHSGRIVRKLSSTPPLGTRMWKLPVMSNPVFDSPQSVVGTSYGDRIKVAEMLHILRPLVHLFTVRLYGNKAWRPWLIALAMDVTSLKMMTGQKFASGKAELQYRQWTLLFYLLRSPFFEKYSREKILRFLKVMAETVPGAGFVCNPLAEYLPTWQSIYFYIWAT